MVKTLKSFAFGVGGPRYYIVCDVYNNKWNRDLGLALGSRWPQCCHPHMGPSSGGICVKFIVVCK